VTPVIEKETGKTADKTEGKAQPRVSVTVKPVTGNAKPAAKPATDTKAKTPPKANASAKPKSVAN
jgi:D-alanyl-D-alanine carboxypeptidase